MVFQIGWKERQGIVVLFGLMELSRSRLSRSSNISGVIKYGITVQYKEWVEELVDLTVVNDLINFKPTKNTTIYPLDEAVDLLLKGKSLLPSEISDFTDVRFM